VARQRQSVSGFRHDSHAERSSSAGTFTIDQLDAVSKRVGNVRALDFRFLDPSGEWRTSWGLPGSAQPVPNAVEMRLELASGERIVRLVDLLAVTP